MMQWRKWGSSGEDFNPTLVQLEFITLRWVDAPMLNFNPTLVQLEWKAPMFEIRPLERFQSHIGAIRIRWVGGLSLDRSYFNPTLVQLELELSDWTRVSLGAAFQSHIGAIRISKSLREKNTKRNFNPTLVQLEFPPRKPRKASSSPFQSHIGAIRMSKWSGLRYCNASISIPHWCN